MTKPETIDLMHRQLLVRRLRTIRKELGMSLVDVADDMGTSTAFLGKLEAGGGECNYRVATVQRLARAVGYRLEFQVVGVPAVPPTPEVERLLLTARWSPDSARSALVASLRAVRRHLGLTLAQVGAGLGVGESAVGEFELCRAGSPNLLTCQRYARVLGGRVVGQVVPAPSVDAVLVERVAAGAAALCELTGPERVLLWERVGRPRSPVGLADRWRTSGEVLRRLVEVAERVAA